MTRHPGGLFGAMAAAAAAILRADTLSCVHGFAPSFPEPLTRISGLSNRILPPGPLSSSRLRSTNGGGEEEARRLKEKADQYRNEAEKLRLTLGLKKAEELEGEIRDFAKGVEDGGAASSASGVREGQKLQELKDRVEGLVRGSLGREEADNMLAALSSFATKASSESKSPDTEGTDAALPELTEDDISQAIEFLIRLPRPIKETLARAAGYPSYDSRPSMEKLVRRLHAKNGDISTEQLRRLYFQAFSENLSAESSIGKSAKEELDEEYEITGMSKLLASKIEERLENSTRAMELFPRSVQDADEGVLPTAEDADVIFQLLDKSFMATEKPMKVSGGYIIRGVNKRKSAGELLDALDGRLAKKNPEWTEKYQMSFVEIYSDVTDELFEDAVLITPNKFAPLAPRLLAGVTTAVSLFSTFVYCIDAYGENPVVMERLKGAVEIAQNGGVYDLTWFNELLVPLLVTLGAAQGFHELGHYLVAWSKQVKLTSPTILPAQMLPYLSFQNRLKTSPKGYADLFDIAFVGPIAGLSVSFVALLVGLQLTTTVDPSTAQILPSLPVGYLTQSTLGGTIVDLVLGGGDGILLNQDATTQVPLHPVAIGGFLGLIIHALDLVPVGSTDGGRISQAILGRVWHLTFSSVVFLVLFISSFTSDSGILLSFLFIYSFTQRDMEIPCRNEIDKVELPRAVAALVSWLLAALILVPLR